MHFGEPKQLQRSYVIGEVRGPMSCNIFPRHFTDDTGVMHFLVCFHFADDMGVCVFCVCPTTPMSSAGTIYGYIYIGMYICIYIYTHIDIHTYIHTYNTIQLQYNYNTITIQYNTIHYNII